MKKQKQKILERKKLFKKRVKRRILINTNKKLKRSNSRKRVSPRIEASRIKTIALTVVFALIIIVIGFFAIKYFQRGLVGEAYLTVVDGKIFDSSLDTGLVSYWSFNELDGSDAVNAVDVWGSNDGTNNGGAWIEDGFRGHGIDFDGIDDNVTILDDDSLDFGTNADFSFCLWVNVSTYGSGKQLLVKRDGPESDYEIMLQSDGKIALWVGEATGVVSTSTVPIDEWSHICVVRESGTVKAYLNTNPEISAASARDVSSDANLYLGKDPWEPNGDGEYYDGLMDEVAIWNRALSDTEINELYYSYVECIFEDSALCNSLVSYWPFDNEVGGITEDSWRNNDGTNNGATLASGKVGDAYSFDGVDDYISVPDAPELSGGGKDFTWAFWVKPRELGEIPFSKYKDTNDKDWGFVIDGISGGIAFGYENDGNQGPSVVSSPLIIDSWNYVVATYDESSDTVTFYIAGVYSSSGVLDYKLPDTTTNIAFGRRNYPYDGSYAYFNGDIDEVGIWNRGLSEDEVGELYNSYPDERDKDEDGYLDSAFSATHFAELCRRYADNNGRDSATWSCVDFDDTALLTDFVGGVDLNDDFDFKINSDIPEIRTGSQLCRRHADNNGRDSADWDCVYFDNTTLLTDFVGNVNYDDDFDLKINSDIPEIQTGCQLCRRYADNNGRDSATWECVDFDNTTLLTDFVGDVGADDDFDLKINCSYNQLCSDPTNPWCSDCNDTDELIYPGAVEVCDGIDQDCDGTDDNGFTDTDGDFMADCVDTDDDDDTLLDVNDNCPLIANLDQADTDGDGSGDACDVCVDLDGDGYGYPGDASCTYGVNEDCDDSDDWINPGVIEAPVIPASCDGVDNNCNGEVDEGFTDTDSDGDADCVDTDDDGDTVSDVEDNCPLIANPGQENLDGDETGDACDGDIDGDGYLSNGGRDSTDCDDNDALVHPGAAEVCNNVDDDCDYNVDEGFDLDGDGYLPDTCTGYSDYDCDDDTSDDPAECPLTAGECDDTTIDCAICLSPGAADYCDSEEKVVNMNCNVDDDINLDCDEWCADIDEDDYVTDENWNKYTGFFNRSCKLMKDSGDCVEGDAAINPGEDEIFCNLIDENCDSLDDNGTDVDGDGYSIEGGLCLEVDCDDTNENVYPGEYDAQACGDLPCEGEERRLCNIDGTYEDWGDCDYTVADGNSCSNSDLCTENSTCANGNCIGGDAIECDDYGVCAGISGYIHTGTCDVTGGCYKIKAPAELCDGIDNDCDGDVNEECPNIVGFSSEITTLLSNLTNLSNVSNFSIGIIERGKVEWIDQGIDIRNLSFNKYLKIENWSVSINTSNLPNVNTTAIITIYNVTLNNPIILVDGEVCDWCERISFEDKTLMFSVDHWTTYTLEEGTYCGDGSCNGNEGCSSCSSDCGICTSSGSTGGGSSGGGYYTNPSEIVYLVNYPTFQGGYKRSVIEGNQFKIDMTGELDYHFLKVYVVIADSVTFTIDDVEFIVSVGGEKEVNIDSDGDNDLVVKIEKIENNKVTMSIQETNTEAEAVVNVPAMSCSDGIRNQGETGVDCGGPCPACAAVEQPTGDVEKGGSFWWWLLLIVVLLGVLGGGGYLIIEKRKSYLILDKEKQKESLEQKSIMRLQNYIKLATSKGYKKAQIEQALLREGWNQSIVDDVFLKTNTGEEKNEE